MTKHFENLQILAVSAGDDRFYAAIETPERELVWQSKDTYPGATAAYMASCAEITARCEFRCRMVIAVERGMEVGS